MGLVSPLGQKGLVGERSEFGSGLRNSIVLDCVAIPNPVLWTCILNTTLLINVLFQMLMFLQEQAGGLYWLLFLNPAVV